jgi:hypothetical protein
MKTSTPSSFLASSSFDKAKAVPSSRRVLELVPETAAAAARLSSWSMPRRGASSRPASLPCLRVGRSRPWAFRLDHAPSGGAHSCHYRRRSAFVARRPSSPSPSRRRSSRGEAWCVIVHIRIGELAVKARPSPGAAAPVLTFLRLDRERAITDAPPSAPTSKRHSESIVMPPAERCVAKHPPCLRARFGHCRGRATHLHRRSGCPEERDTSCWVT